MPGGSNPRSSDFDALARASLPDRSEVAVFAEADQQRAKARQLAERELEKAVREAATAEATMLKREGEAKGATRADWLAARERRDAALDGLEQALDGDAGAAARGVRRFRRAGFADRFCRRARDRRHRTRLSPAERARRFGGPSRNARPRSGGDAAAGGRARGRGGGMAGALVALGRRPAGAGDDGARGPIKRRGAAQAAC